jgi:prevent-host-death family protein
MISSQPLARWSLRSTKPPAIRRRFQPTPIAGDRALPLTTWRACTSMMSMKALPIGEARRRLPELVRRVATGQRAVAIGRGGRPEVMLVPASTQSILIARRPLRGLVEIVGSDEELAHGQRLLRQDIETSLQRTARLISDPPRARRARASSSIPMLSFGTSLDGNAG